MEDPDYAKILDYPINNNYPIKIIGEIGFLELVDCPLEVKENEYFKVPIKVRAFDKNNKNLTG